MPSTRQPVTPEHSLPPFRLALAAMPWTPFNRPSIQLGALKAFLSGRPGIEVDTLHPYLEAAREIGTGTYHFISQDPWISEALYSSILFPDHSRFAEKLATERLARKWKIKKTYHFDFHPVKKALDCQLSAWIDNHDWSRYNLIGFTVCFNQLLSSLTAAARIKESYPDIPVVFGGSSCVGDMGRSLLTFPQIDYIVPGEGEIPLLALCESLRDREKIPATVFSRGQNPDTASCPQQVLHLNDLPPPDYDDYFTEVTKNFTRSPFIPVLPVEFSRGCWWEKCAFCNLNLQWQGYRRKSAGTMVEQVTSMARRYRVLDFFFTDNALPPREADLFFAAMGSAKKDISFFAEIRATTRATTLENYRQGGLASIQVGIEALSTSLLRKINKGVTAIENIAAMKHALGQGIELEGNLITEFPGTTAGEIQETLDALDFVLPFPPLTIAAFFLGHGSPVARDPKKFGIRAITKHPGNRALFPPHILNSLIPLIKGYQGDRINQRTLWKPVLKKIAIWHQFHQDRRRSTAKPFALSFRDGPGFLIIRQERPGRPALHHRMQGLSRAIYLSCDTIRTMDELAKEFPSLAREKIRAFLDDLREKRLVFMENDHYLALAVRETPHTGHAAPS